MFSWIKAGLVGLVGMIKGFGSKASEATGVDIHYG